MSCNERTIAAREAPPGAIFCALSVLNIFSFNEFNRSENWDIFLASKVTKLELGSISC